MLDVQTAHETANRRRLLKLLGGGAVAALVGARSAQAAGTSTVTITNILNNLTATVTVKKACAPEVCSAIDAVNSIAVSERFTCTIS